MRSKRIMRIFSLYWAPFLCYVGLLTFMSHQSEPLGGISVPVSDKIVHFFEFFLLLFFSVRAFSHSPWHRIQKRALLAGIVFSFLYAVGDEIHQAFIPYREASVFDVCADGIGIMAGAVLFRHRAV